MKELIRRIVYRFRGEFTTVQLQSMGLIVGKNFKRLHGVILDPSHCWLITIGDNVTMAPNVHVLCHDASTKYFLDYTKIGRVTIGNNVFIGASSIILPNVKIGDNVIIGANSTITRDIPDGIVVAGSPAKKICTIEEYLEKEKITKKDAPIFSEDYTLLQGITSKQKKEQKMKLNNRIGYIK